MSQAACRPGHRWRPSECLAARRPRPVRSRRCAAITVCTLNVSRATRAEMMFELSPLLTAAKASALLDAGRDRACCLVEADAGDRRPAEVGRRAGGTRSGSMVDDGHALTRARSRWWARAIEPTRPQPMMTTCTRHISSHDESVANSDVRLCKLRVRDAHNAGAIRHVPRARANCAEAFRRAETYSAAT